MKILKPNEVAKILGVSQLTLQNWDKAGQLKAYRNPNNRRFYTDEQIEQFIESCKR